MAYGTTKTGDFEDAIKNFSIISLEVEGAKKKSGDAHKIINKSIENRNEAIENEVSRRLKSLDVEEKTKRIEELSNTNLTLETLILEEVEEEFDKGVSELKSLMQKSSEGYENAENRDKKEEKSNNSESTEGEEEESTDAESTGDENTDGENSEDDSTSEESSEEESTESEDTSDEDNDSKAK